MSIFNWELSKEELDKQIREYRTLPITRSSRGVFALVVWGLCIPTLLMIVLSLITPLALVDITVLCILGVFVLKGYRWAMYMIIILWTYEKIFTILSIQSNISGSLIQIVFWLIVLNLGIQAILVENKRRTMN